MDKKRISAIDFYIAAVLILFYVVTDIVYPVIMLEMSIQISDWWIAANVVVPLVEIICCMIIKISKNSDPSSKAEQKALINLMTQVVAAISGTSIMPSMTSGEEGSSKETTESELEESLEESLEEYEEVVEEEEEEEAMG